MTNGEARTTLDCPEAFSGRQLATARACLARAAEDCLPFDDVAEAGVHVEEVAVMLDAEPEERADLIEEGSEGGTPTVYYSTPEECANATEALVLGICRTAAKYKAGGR